LNVNCSDRYLLDYMRIKIIDKASVDPAKGVNCMTFNSMKLDNVSIPCNEEGYLLVIEGAMPYNTTEGQL